MSRHGNSVLRYAAMADAPSSDPTISELFNPDDWEPVSGFDFTDITYHRARDTGAVRIAFDRARDPQRLPTSYRR